jgi:hypothetical protein
MSKQPPAETSPQQLVLDLHVPKSVESSAACNAAVLAFVDSATRSVREKAIERVKSSGIFQLPVQR